MLASAVGQAVAVDANTGEVAWEVPLGLTEALPEDRRLTGTPHSLSWIIFLESGAGGMEWSGPASYVKIRDELYLAYWLEEACNGTSGESRVGADGAQAQAVWPCRIIHAAVAHCPQVDENRPERRFNVMNYFTS